MFQFWVDSFWLFLPALVANQCPGFVAFIARKWWAPLHLPVSQQWLGGSKTWSAYYAGPAAGVLVAITQGWTVGHGFDFVLIGFLMGLGAVLGDHVESFFKRRIGIKAGDPFWPFDQIDFALGAFVLSWFVKKWEMQTIIVIIASMLVIHPVGNFIGMKLGLRKTWW